MNLIELSDDTISNIVLQDLKGSYDLCREYDDDVRMRALQTVLEYYMVPSEFKEWLQNTQHTEDMVETGTINVKDCVEHEDGSATLVVDTDNDATRLLVEVGLRRLLEMAVDEENKEYEFTSETKEDLAEATEGSVQEEVGQG